MKNRSSFISGFAIAAVLAVTSMFVYSNRASLLDTVTTSTASTAVSAQAVTDNLVQIQPASTVIRDLRATGNIELAAQRTVALKANAEITGSSR